MDDQIMNNIKITENDEPTPLIEVDIYNHALMAKWIKDKLQELDAVLTQSMESENFV